MDNKEKKEKKETTLFLTIDMGGSQNKAIYQLYPDAYPKSIKLGSEIADISYKSKTAVPNEGTPSGRVWVGFEGEYYVLGSAALQFSGSSQINELKYQLAVPKICGLIWLVKEKLGLESSFSAIINVLLPPAEMADKDELKLSLKSALKSFETPSGKMKIKLAKFSAATEGSGIYFYFRHSHNGIIPNALFLMMGFRNASAFLVRDGVLNRGVTSNFGMSWLVNSFVSKVSGLNADDFRVVEAIVAAGENCDPSVLQRLSRKRKPEEIKADGELMSAAALVARDEYWRAIVRWLRSVIKSDIKGLVLCGGTADYLRSEIDAYCQENGLKVFWHGNVNVPTDISMGLGNRMADVYALHQYSVIMLDKMNNTNQERHFNYFSKLAPKPQSQINKQQEGIRKNFLTMASDI
jgi:hypothetical protein